MIEHSRVFRCNACAALAIIAAAQVSPAEAQQNAAEDSPSDKLEEIVVTANKRAENLQAVPIAITAVTAERLENTGISSTEDLAQVVPGLVIQQSMNGSQAHLRGIGTTATAAGEENSIATYIDGVYIASLSGSLLQLNSIQQVEVLKGPQGTLFGRNATGGVISVRTRDPQQDLGGDFNLRYGNYNTVSGSGYITGGLTQNLAADLAVYVSDQGEGWGRNLYNGRDANTQNDYAARTKWLLTASDNDRIRVALDFAEADGNRGNSFAPLYGTTANDGPGNTLAAQRPDQAPYIASGAQSPIGKIGDPYTYTGGFYNIDSFTQPHDLFRQSGASLQWDHDSGNARLTSITAYRHASTDQQWGAEPVPADVFHAGWAERESQFSQELQLGSVAGSRVQWVAGLYYLYGKAYYDPFHFGGTAYIPVDTITFHSFTSAKSGAAFGQATTALWDGAHLTAGVRYSVERRAIEGDTVVDFLPFTGIPQLTSGLTDAHTTFRKPTWRLALDQQITRDILGYVSYNRGFKSGIYNSIPPGGPDAQPVAPEILDAYEVGFKSDLFDGHLRLNVSGYYYNYSNLQVTIYTNTGAALQNGAKAEIYGGDLDLTGKIGSHLTLTAGANLMHSEFKSFPQAQFLIPQPASAGGGTVGVVGSAKGNELPYAPNSTFNVGADYSTPLGNGKADLNINYGYTGRWFSGPDNLLRQGSYGLLNATASYTLPGDHIDLGFWARNLTDEKYYTFLTSLGNPAGVTQGIVGAPRTYGISLGYKF